MDCKKLQTKVYTNLNDKDRKFSSSVFITYFDSNTESNVYDYNSYFDLNLNTFDDAIKHINEHKQIHNYYSLAYNEMVPNMNKFLIRVKIKLSELEEIKSKMSKVDKVLNGMMQHQMLYDLSAILDLITPNDYEYADIALYPTSITSTSGIIRTKSELDLSQNILAISRTNEYTNIKDLDLGGFGNTVSGFNSAAFEFYPFFYDNKICIQITGTGKLSLEGFNVGFATYNSNDMTPNGTIDFTFEPIDEKAKIANNKKEFTIFNDRINNFLVPEDAILNPIKTEDKLNLHIKSVVYSDKDITSDFVNTYLNGEYDVTLDLLHRLPMDIKG